MASADEDDDIAAAGGSSKAALSQILQQLQQGQQVLLARVLPGQHFTKPPARYSEASMIKTLEEVGVGRPSTYAPIIRKLLVSPGCEGVQNGGNVCGMQPLSGQYATGHAAVVLHSGSWHAASLSCSLMKLHKNDQACCSGRVTNPGQIRSVWLHGVRSAAW